MNDNSVKKINVEIDGKDYLTVTKNGKTELGIKGNTTSEKGNTPHEVNVPNILIITRKMMIYYLSCMGKKKITLR